MSKTVFILGAGASYSHSNKEFPLINDIFKASKKLSVTTHKNKSDTLNSDYECVEKYIKENYNKSILDLRQALDIEDILTNLEIDIEKTKSNDLQIVRDRIITIILITFFKLTGNSDYYKNGEYFLFYDKLKDNDTIITYNWDVLLDNILDREKLIIKIKNRNFHKTDEDNTLKKQYLRMLLDLSAYRDYYNFRITAPYEHYHSEGYYLKLHGSVDWLYCPNEDCGLYAKVFPIKNIYGKYKCSECSSRMKHLIIPPVLNKNYSGFPFIKKIWNIALEEIRLAEELVIWGYQLPHSDFYNRWLFRQTSVLLRKVVIIDPKCYKKDKNQHITQNKKEFLDNFLSIFQTGKKYPDMIYYEYFKDYINGTKYTEKYKRK